MSKPASATYQRLRAKIEARRAELEAARLEALKELETQLDNDFAESITSSTSDSSARSSQDSSVKDSKDWESLDKESPELPFNPSFSPEDYTAKFINFMNTSPTTYHAVRYLANELEDGGFKYLSERDSWDDVLFPKSSSSSSSSKGVQKFYTTRNGSSLVAFTVSPDWKPRHGMASIGAHIDALCAKLKPVSKLEPKEGFLQLGVAPYAGSFSGPTWWDRDLGIGGKVVIRKGGKVTSALAHIAHPIARIPTLAPHFGTPAVGPFNPETQMAPIIGLDDGSEEVVPTEDEKSAPLYGLHDLKILRAIAKNVGVEVKDILQFDLELFDTQPATVGGLEKDLLFCPRIDDKICSYSSIHALLDAEDDTPSDGFRLVALFDDEEIGSLIRQGARGGFLESVVDRVLGAYGETSAGTLREFYANSFFISSDVSHAVNPNFANVYLDHHKPKLNVGLTVTADPNGHMTTDAVSTSLFYEIARQTGNKLQLFQIRNDSRSGGTIGPALSSSTGMRSIDCGIAQLSMHSIRATVGSKDVWLAVKMLKAYFERYYSVDAQFKLGDL